MVFPGAEASYVTVASVILDVAKIEKLDRERPVNPKEFRATEKAESIDCALPGCNIITDGENSAKASLRKSIFEVFGSVRMSSEGESLLDTYEALLKYKPITERKQECPYEDCLKEYQRGNGKYTCPCELSRSLYSTDALRIHERMNPAGTNGAIFAEIMQVWERIWVVHILRTLEAKNWLSSLRRLAIVFGWPPCCFRTACLDQPIYLSRAI